MTVDVHVVTPEREVWAGPAETVIARGVDGEVGILAGHMPLLVRLAVGPLRIQQDDGTELEAVVDGGFLHVTSGSEGQTRVDILATQAELRSEIDVEVARGRVSELQALLDDGSTERSESEIEATRADLQKAQARINLAG